MQSPISHACTTWKWSHFHWIAISSHSRILGQYMRAQWPVQTRFNHRLTTTNTRVGHEHLGELFDAQTTYFIINFSYGYILNCKQTGRFRYYHSSCNCRGCYLEEPSLITNRAGFDSFLERIHESDILQWVIAQRPKSDWVCVLVTNVPFYANRIPQHSIGCDGVNLPTFVKCNKTVIGLEKDHHIAT